MVKEELKDRVRLTMDLAKNLLQKDGNLAPVAIFVKAGFPDYPMLLDFKDEESKLNAHRQVQEFIIRFTPDYCVLVAEAWMKKVHKDTIGNYRRGDVAKSSDKVEIVSVVGGSVDGTYGILQTYHREKKQIIFDEVIEDTNTFESAFFGDAWDIIACETVKNWS
jgi:hypothetical protein